MKLEKELQVQLFLLSTQPLRERLLQPDFRSKIRQEILPFLEERRRLQLEKQGLQSSQGAVSLGAGLLLLEKLGQEPIFDEKYQLFEVKNSDLLKESNQKEENEPFLEVQELVLKETLEWKGRSLQFSYTEAGKPYFNLTGQIDRKEIQFNLSHSESTVLLGISHQGPIGVDLQLAKSLKRNLWRHFALDEITFLDSIMEREGFDSPALIEAFYTLWTRKEAYGKALGCGLAKVLSVSLLHPEKDANLRRFVWYEGKIEVEKEDYRYCVCVDTIDTI